MKIAIVQLLAFVGIVVGYFVAPSKPLYPFIPTEMESQLIMYKEFHILFIVGLCVSGFAFLAGKILNCPTKISFVSSLIAGSAISIIYAFRVGTISAAISIYAIGYIAAIFCVLGIYSFLNYCFSVHAEHRT